MITILFKILCFLALILSIIFVFIGGLYILYIEILMFDQEVKKLGGRKLINLDDKLGRKNN